MNQEPTPRDIEILSKVVVHLLSFPGSRQHSNNSKGIQGQTQLLATQILNR